MAVRCDDNVHSDFFKSNRKGYTMIKSMTGYGSAEGDVGGRRLFVDMRAVNHRYFAFQAKMPGNLMVLEGRIQALAKERLTRGQISVFANWDRKGQGAAAPAVHINMDAARQAAALLKALKDELRLDGEVELSHVLAVPEVMSAQEVNVGEEAMQEAAFAVFEQALKGMEQFRNREGEDLERDLRDRIALFVGFVGQIEERRPKIVAEQKARLEKRVAELVGDKANEALLSERLALEIAMYADRLDVSEELVRLKSHTAKFLELLAEKAAVGRKLDFLLQEFNREVNTVGSKTPDAETARVVVEMKAELEKMREQVQNVE